MQVFIGLKRLPEKFERAVVTLGVFDGVHRAHQHIIETAVERAEKRQVRSLCISFDPHPGTVKSEDDAFIPILTTMKEKIRYLEEIGLDGTLFLDITEKFLNLSADDFINKILVEKIKAREVVVGYNYRFGKDREGNTDLLKKKGREYGFKTHVIKPFKIDESIVSSTLIRNLIEKGNIEQANKMLGKPYCILGRVGKGNQIGRQIGFPTANVVVHESEKLLPGNGVYFTEITLEGEEHFGICNLGIRPTFGYNDRGLEVHILGLDKIDLYDKEIKLKFLERMRNEQKFESVDKLVQQIKKDKQEGLKKISKYKTEEN
ncbi:MAG TPA: bifunctional riboflavin kinase/FAD synthetase [bacterium]|nr:bifunctional riboflavin kinase/FAD synthetase [bacterium]